MSTVVRPLTTLQEEIAFLDQQIAAAWERLHDFEEEQRSESGELWLDMESERRAGIEAIERLEDARDARARLLRRRLLDAQDQHAEAGR